MLTTLQGPMLVIGPLLRELYLCMQGAASPTPRKGSPRGELSAQRTEGWLLQQPRLSYCMLNGPLCEGAPAKRVGERPCYATSYPPYKWCYKYTTTTIYTLPKRVIKTLSKKPKKVLDKGHTPCYNNQAVSRGGQPLKLVTTACMAILKPKGFKKYRKKFLTKELL